MTNCIPEKKKDIFDRIMHTRLLRVFEPFYLRYKEILLYLFFGGLTFVVSVGSYAFFNAVIGLNVLVANVISWILAVLFAYLTNRTWVFKDKAYSAAGIVKEMLLFFGGRLATLAVEEAILYVFITRLQFNSIAVKVIAQIIVVLLNYVISKLVVFRKSGRKDENG